MSADVLEQLDTKTLEGLAPPCDLHVKPEQICPDVAEWAAITKCCGLVILMCDGHQEAFLKMIAGDKVFRCAKCNSYHPYSPFASLDRL